MANPIFKYEVIIRETHLDTYGHVNNAAYLGLTMKFLKEVTVREKITITLQLLDYKGKISRFRQEMIKEDGTVATEMEMTFGLFDLKTRRLIEPTPEWKKAFGLE